MKISFLWFEITPENAGILKNWTNYGYFLKTQVRGIHLNIARGEEDWMFADETVHFYANEASKCSNKLCLRRTKHLQFKVAAHHGKLDQVLDQASGSSSDSSSEFDFSRPQDTSVSQLNRALGISSTLRRVRTEATREDNSSSGEHQLETSLSKVI